MSYKFELDRHEYVGYYTGETGNEIYDNVPEPQQKSGLILLEYLMNKYSIDRNNVFRHPQVQDKNPTEAQSVQIPQKSSNQFRIIYSNK